MDADKIKRCNELLKSLGFSEWSYWPPVNRFLYKYASVYIPPPYVLGFLSNFIIYAIYGWVLVLVTTTIISIIFSGFEAKLLSSAILISPLFASLVASLYSLYRRKKANIPLWEEI